MWNLRMQKETGQADKETGLYDISPSQSIYFVGRSLFK